MQNYFGILNFDPNRKRYRVFAKKLHKSVFLSSANEVSTGPTCQFLSVCLFVFPVFFSRVKLDDILASDSGSGNLLIRLGV